MRSIKTSKLIENFVGQCSLTLKDRIVNARCVLHVYQDYVDDIPGLKHADGSISNLPTGDILFAMMGQEPIDMELDDGRCAKVLLTDSDGSYVVTGPVERSTTNPTARA